MQSVLSVDIGTTAVKVSLVERGGRIAFNVVGDYPSDSSFERVEQDPELWWDAFINCLTKLRLEYPDISAEAIVLSGQMQDLICITDGKLAGPAILYSDTRAAAEWDYIADTMGAETFSDTVQNLGDPSILPAKILWLKRHIPEMVKEPVMFLMGAHDYICWKLTGLCVTDYTNASTTGLLNFAASCWDKEILAIAGITEKNLPALVRADSVTGAVNASAAMATGLPEGLPVIHGAGDAASSTVGAGAGVEGVYSAYLGTSGWIASTSACHADPDTGIYNLKHPDPEKVLNIGPMLLTGGNIEWVLKTFLAESGAAVSGELFDFFTAAAELAPPGSGGLFYLPHLSGERSPFRDSLARGAFIGLTKMSGKGEMFRAVLEGICYSLRSIIEIISQEDFSDRKIHLSGGGAGNRLWVEILSSVANAPISRLENARESGVLGNAIIAGNALGWFDTYSVPSGFVHVENEFQPEQKLSALYDEGYKIFKNLYPALKSTFRDISSWNN